MFKPPILWMLHYMVVLQNRLVTCGHHESLLQCKYNYCTNLYQNLKDNKHKGVNEKDTPSFLLTPP